MATERRNPFAVARGLPDWPDDDGLAALMAEHRSFSGVAQACGKRRESLRDYLAIRPELNQRMRALLKPRLSDEEKRVLKKARTRAYHIAHPERRRAHRRRWVRGRVRVSVDTKCYDELLRTDPCAYCGGRAATVDHIEPRDRGGSDEWENLTSACGGCNDSKHTKSLLFFLLGRG